MSARDLGLVLAGAAAAVLVLRYIQSKGHSVEALYVVLADRGFFPESDLATLCAYRWPGNLAEFTQVVSQVVTTTETRVITSEQLPLRIHELNDWPALSDYLAGQEKQYIARVLNACQGDKARAAAALKIDIGRLG